MPEKSTGECLYSIWKVEGNDLAELHLGHAAVLFQLRQHLTTPGNSATIILQPRESYGVKPDITSRNTRAYKRFFELALSHSEGGRDRPYDVSVRFAADLLGDHGNKAIKTLVREALVNVDILIDRLATGVSDREFKLLVEDAFPNSKFPPADLRHALKKAQDKGGHETRFEGLALESTTILCVLAEQGELVIAGKRHDFKYGYSDMVIRLLGRDPLRSSFVDNIPDPRSGAPMETRAGSPILLTASQSDVEDALCYRKTRKGVDGLAPYWEGVVVPAGGGWLFGRTIAQFKDLTAEELGDSDVWSEVASAILASLSSFRRASKRAYVKSRGDALHFSAERCLRHLQERYDSAAVPISENATNQPLEYRGEYIDLQDMAMNHTKGMWKQPKRATPTIGNVTNLFGACRDIDVLSYFTSKRYRDHHIHVANTLYAGQILQDLKVGGKPIHEQIADALGWKGAWAPRAVESAWTYAALLHDHCYPVSFALANAARLSALSKHFVGGSTEALREAFKHAMTNLLGPTLGAIVETLLEGESQDSALGELGGMLTTYFGSELAIQGRSISGTDALFDHGVLAAINLLDTAEIKNRKERIVDDPAAVVFEAARGIVFHNLAVTPGMDGQELPVEISFLDNPIGALLVLCDEMQEWGRTSLGPHGFETMISEMVLRPVSGDALDGDVLHCQFDYEHSDEKGFYEWNFDLFAQGKTQNLKRLSFEGTDFPKRFEFSIGIDGMGVELRKE